jgi:hypothetical protein
MKFPYFEVTPEIKRPIIPLVLKSQNKFILYSAIIDSGADHCVFSIDIAYALGIKLHLKDKVKFLGVGKEKIEGYHSKIGIKIDEATYSADVIFAEISDFGHGILGQNGFFDHFDVRLSFDREIIELEPIRIRN